MQHPFIAALKLSDGSYIGEIQCAAEIDIATEEVAALYLLTWKDGKENQIEIIRNERDPDLRRCWEAASAALAGERKAIEEKIVAARRGLFRNVAVVGGEYDRFRA